MQSDYSVRLTATDEASPQLEKVRAKFHQIENSTKPLKGKLREIQTLLANMNMDGLDQTSLFTEIAQSAGAMRDAIGDANTAINRFADDTMRLSAAADAMKLVAGAGAIATSTMALFGKENENVEKAILKVQSALAILNGVQAIANTLNKDSALIQTIKQVKLNLTTVAIGRNAAATTLSTVAQNAWNVATAIGKALLGDFTGLLIVAGAGLVGYSMFADNAKDSQDNLNKSVDDAAKRQEEFASDVASSAAKQLLAYRSLQEKWNECNGDVAKQQKFMADYKDEIKATGLQVNSLSDAEKVFVTDTDSVVKAIMARAQAQAAYNLAVKEMEAKLQDQYNPTVANGGKYVKATKWSDLTDEEKAVYEKNRTKKVDFNEINRNRNQKAVEKMRERDKAYDNRINSYVESAEKAGEEASKYFRNGGGGGGGTGHGGGGGGNNNNQLPIMPDSITAKEKEIADLQQRLKNGLLPEDQIQATMARIERLKKEVKDEKIRLGLEPPAKEEVKAVLGSYEDLTQKIAEMENNLKKGLVDDNDIEATKKAIDSLKKQLKNEAIKIGIEAEAKEGSVAKLEKQKTELENKLKNEPLDVAARLKIHGEIAQLQKQIDEKTKGKVSIPAEVKPSYTYADGQYWDKRGSRENANTRMTQIKSDYEAGIIGYQEAKNQIDDLNKQLKELGMKPITIKLETNFEQLLKGIKSGLGSIDAINSTTDSVMSLVNAIDEGKNGWEIYKAVVSTVSSVLNSITTVMETINKIQEISNIIKGVTNTQTEKEAAVESTKAAAMATEIALAPEMVAANATIATSATTTTVALKAQEAAYLDLAAAAIFAAHASIPFAGVGIASGFITTMMGAMSAQHAASMALQAFANGGIIGGGNYHGDKVLARLNSGEMVLNMRQQSQLFRAIDSGNLGINTSNTASSLTFRIKGSDLYGALSNYSKVKAKSGKITGIK